MSKVSDEFEAAVKVNDWDTAFKRFRILNMEEMLLSLHDMKDKRETFWNQRLNFMTFESELPRWEYAYTVVQFHALPATAPVNVPADQVAAAMRFLKQIVRTSASSLEQNLALSMQAVNYVLTTTKLQGANYDFYNEKTSSKSYEYYLKKAKEEKNELKSALMMMEARTHMDKLDVCLETVREGVKADKASSGATATLDLYRIVARRAKENRCGNCGENSILTFMFLYDLGVRPLDRVKLELDHDFVVIGRAAGNIHDSRSWGPTAVVCDSWAQGLAKGNTVYGTYPGSQYETKMGALMQGSLKIKDSYREN